MAKTQEELNELKNEYETLNNKLQELTEDELMQVTGGVFALEGKVAEVKNFLENGTPGAGAEIHVR